MRDNGYRPPMCRAVLHETAVDRNLWQRNAGHPRCRSVLDESVMHRHLLWSLAGLLLRTKRNYARGLHVGNPRRAGMGLPRDGRLGGKHKAFWRGRRQEPAFRLLLLRRRLVGNTWPQRNRRKGYLATRNSVAARPRQRGVGTPIEHGNARGRQGRLDALI